MGDSASELPPSQATEALVLMEQALLLLDDVETPIEVAGHLDLAIARLREALPRTKLSSRLAKTDELPSGQQTSASSPKPGG
jgi:hypothetical protein